MSYADLITLLFALFVVLYASSQADLAKLKKVGEGLRKSLGAPAAGAGAGADAGAGGGGTSAENSSRGTTVRDELHPFRDLEHTLRDAVEAHEVSVQATPGRIALTFTLGEIFPGASQPQVPFAERRPAIERVGRAVAAHLRASAGQLLTIESRAASFGLASARAAWLARDWSARLGVEPERIEIQATISVDERAPSVLRAVLRVPEAAEGAAAAGDR